VEAAEAVMGDDSMEWAVDSDSRVGSMRMRVWMSMRTPCIAGGSGGGALVSVAVIPGDLLSAAADGELSTDVDAVLPPCELFIQEEK
jgi:hypothetical protein